MLGSQQLQTGCDRTKMDEEDCGLLYLGANTGTCVCYCFIKPNLTAAMQHVCFIFYFLFHTYSYCSWQRLMTIFLATKKIILSHTQHPYSTAYFILHIKFNSLKCKTNSLPPPPSSLSSPNVYNLRKRAALLVLKYCTEYGAWRVAHYQPQCGFAI